MKKIAPENYRAWRRTGPLNEDRTPTKNMVETPNPKHLFVGKKEAVGIEERVETVGARRSIKGFS